MLPADIDCYGYYDSGGAAADYFISRQKLTALLGIKRPQRVGE